MARKSRAHMVSAFAARQRLVLGQVKVAEKSNEVIATPAKVDGDHGRIETRTYTAIHEVAWLQERYNWLGLGGVVMVESTGEIGDKIERETRFYITSLVSLADALGPVIRSHGRWKTASTG